MTTENHTQLALEIKERDCGSVTLGVAPIWLVSLFCILYIKIRTKIRPQKTGKNNSKGAGIPQFLTPFLSWILGVDPIISSIFKEKSIDNYKTSVDTYVALPSKTNNSCKLNL